MLASLASNLAACVCLTSPAQLGVMRQTTTKLPPHVPPPHKVQTLPRVKLMEMVRGAGFTATGLGAQVVLDGTHTEVGEFQVCLANGSLYPEAGFTVSSHKSASSIGIIWGGGVTQRYYLMVVNGWCTLPTTITFFQQFSQTDFHCKGEVHCAAVVDADPALGNVEIFGNRAFSVSSIEMHPLRK